MRLISSDALAQYMAFRGFTVRSLAERVGCSHSTIGHLRRGSRSTCKPQLARSIAKALDCPVQSLFAPKVSHVSGNPRRVA